MLRLATIIHKEISQAGQSNRHRELPDRFRKAGDPSGTIVSSI
jgi:hypothetical protein